MPTQQHTKPAAGQQPTAPLTTREKIERARQHAATVRRHATVVHQHTAGVQKQIAPFAGMGLLVLAATALHAAKDATAADAEILGGTAAVCVVVAVVAAHQMRKRLDDRKSLHRGLAFIATAGTWLVTTAAIGVSWNAAGLLAVLGTALSLHYLRKVRIPNTRPVTDMPGPSVPASEKTVGDEFRRRWDTFIGNQGGCLPGAKLSAPQKVKAGWRFAVELIPGKQSLASLMAVLGLLRGGLGLTVEQDLLAERHPTLAEPTVQLTVITKSPIKDAHEWPGPATFRTGMIDLGPFIDGEGHAQWLVNSEDRFKGGGFIQGGSGAGKSRLIESIVMSMAASTDYPIVIWFGDGQGNSSSPMLMKHADFPARTFEQIQQMYACAMLVMELRQDENGLEEEVGFYATEDRPALLLVLDECHKPLSPVLNPDGAATIQFMAMTIAREGQKVGVQTLLATQESTLGAFGGAGNNAEMLRSNLLMTNGVMMRSKDANARQVFKVDDDPSQFPNLPGYALLVSPEEGARTAPFRGYYLTNRLREEWPGRIHWRSLDAGSGNAAGTPYLMRAEIAEMAKEEIRRRVAARRAGTYVPDSVRPVMSGSDGAEASEDVAAFPVWNPVTEKVQERQLEDRHRKVLDALKVGIVSPTPISEATGYSPRQVHNLLDELMDVFGEVERDGHGKYRLVEARTDA